MFRGLTLTGRTKRGLTSTGLAGVASVSKRLLRRLSRVLNSKVLNQAVVGVMTRDFFLQGYYDKGSYV